MKYFIYVIKSGITALSENTESQIKMTVRTSNTINVEDRIIGFCENPISEYRYIFNGLSMSNGKITLAKILQILNGVKSNSLLPSLEAKIKEEIVSGNDLIEITEEQYKEIEKAILNRIGVTLHKNVEEPISNSIPFSRNRIVFGAPGTGKSFQLNEDSKVFGTNFERVTFHPNYSYAQFVGTYKPTMSEPNKKLLSDEQQHILSILQDANKTSQEKYDLLYENFKDGDLTRLPILLGLFTDENFKTKKADGTPAVGDNSVERNHGKAIRPYVNLPIQGSSDEKQIAYQYVSGPFMRIYAAAKQNPNNNYLLLIEEINRANVAAVFGDVFQLLDRNSDGESEYKVAASEDIKKYLAKKGIYEDELSIPSNMYIWATMNSADQGVFPMDTAFKRRWEFEYIGIDDNEDKVKDYEIPINSNQKVNWNELRKAINTKLIEMSINEDKLLGPFFLSKTVLENALVNTKNFVKLFKSKVIMYLFEDAAKMKVKQLFEIDNNKYIFSEICKQFDEKGLDVFQIDISNIKLSENDNTKEDVVVSEGNTGTTSLFEQ